MSGEPSVLSDVVRPVLRDLFTMGGRIFWGSSNKVLDLSEWGSNVDGTEVC